MARQRRLRPTKTEEERERDRAYFRAYRRIWREENVERDRANGRKAGNHAYAVDPEKHRHRVAAARYGITVAEYQALIAQPNCDACGEPTAKRQIDHCHDGTERIRGVLCPNCNSALGHAHDNVERLRLLIAYLEARA